MPQDIDGLGKTVEELKEVVKHLQKRMTAFENDNRMLKNDNEILKTQIASRYKNFENAIKYIETKEFVPLSELRIKFPSFSNNTTIDDFNKIYKDKIAIFSINIRGYPRFYAYCSCSSLDFLHNFSRLWNGTIGIGENYITIEQIKKECDFKSDKEMESVKNFVEKFLNKFASLEGYNLKRKVL